MRSLTEYRETLDRIGQGTVSTDFALEIIAAAEAEIEARSGEFTITQAVESSGRSRSWFERRLARWHEQGLARKLGAVWLLKGAAVPQRKDVETGFDPRLPADRIADLLVA